MANDTVYSFICLPNLGEEAESRRDAPCCAITMCWSLSYLLIGVLLVIHKWSKWLDGEMEGQNKEKEQRKGGIDGSCV